jgi:hypothetical protein
MDQFLQAIPAQWLVSDGRLEKRKRAVAFSATAL